MEPAGARSNDRARQAARLAAPGEDGALGRRPQAGIGAASRDAVLTGFDVGRSAETPPPLPPAPGSRAVAGGVNAGHQQVRTQLFGNRLLGVAERGDHIGCLDVEDDLEIG
jgi:hypothetical protein